MPNKYTSVVVSAANDLSNSFNFIVRLNGISYGFRDVSGIETHRAVDFYSAGGINRHRVMVGMPENQEFSLTFSRGMIVRSSPLVSAVAKSAAAYIPNNIARKSALMAISSLDPQEALESGPALGWVEVYGRSKKMVGLYMFLALGVTSWKISGLSATDPGILIEEFTLAHTGIERIPLAVVPPMYTDLFAKDNTEEQQREEWVRESDSEDTFKVMTDLINAHKKSRENASDKDAGKTEDTHQEMLNSAEKNKKLQEDVEKSLKNLIDKMEEEQQEFLIKQNIWQEGREEGKILAEKVRKACRIRENKWIQASEKLSKFIKSAQVDALKNMRRHIKGLKLANDKARELANKALDDLAMELSDYVAKKKGGKEEFERNKMRIEQARLNALVAAEEARSAARSARKVAKELWAKKWEEKQREYGNEAEDNKQDFEKSRQKGLQETYKRIANREEDPGQMDRNREEFENARAEGLKKTEEKIKDRKESFDQMAKNKEAFENSRAEGLERTEEKIENRKESLDRTARNKDEFEKAREKGLKKANEQIANREESLDRTARNKDEFEKAREKGLKKANEQIANREESFDQTAKNREEFLKKREEYLEQKQQAMEQSKEMAEEAEETAAESDNVADETEAMVEAAAV